MASVKYCGDDGIKVVGVIVCPVGVSVSRTVYQGKSTMYATSTVFKVLRAEHNEDTWADFHREICNFIELKKERTTQVERDNNDSDSFFGRMLGVCSVWLRRIASTRANRKRKTTGKR